MTHDGEKYQESWGEWFDRHSRTFFIAPAVTLILIFAIFPTFYSIVFALSRVKFSPDSLRNGATWIVMIGRLISAAAAIGIAFLLGATLLSGNPWGTLLTTLFYVIVGCAIQFVIGTALAFLCSQPISGKNFFRVIFFIPLMITPLGVGYAFKMILDITKGPFQPFWEFIGLRDWAWSTDAWAARWFVVVGDSWQWIPFIFICMRSRSSWRPMPLEMR